jgi:excisionase family DNA binding protein
VLRQTMSVADAAALLGVHPLTVYRAIERGEIVAVQIGRRKLIAQAEITRLLAGRRFGGDSK